MLVEETEAAPVVDEATPNDLARWHIRAAAFAVDVMPGVAVVATMALVWLAVPPQQSWWWASISVLAGAALVTMANRVVLPAILGWSLGRALLGITLVQQDGAAVGARPTDAEGTCPPARHTLGIRRMAVAAVGFTSAHLRRLAAAHRSASRLTTIGGRQRSGATPRLRSGLRCCSASPVPL